MVLDALRSNASSWVIKVVFAVIILVFVFWGIGSFDSSTNAVARVDGITISNEEFAHEYKRAEEDMRARSRGALPDNYDKALKQNVLRRMVDQVLIQNAATELGLSVSDAELAEFITSTPAFQDANGRFSKEFYDNYLKATRQSFSSYENAIRYSLNRDKLIESVVMSVKVSEPEARQVFDSVMEKRAVAYRIFPWEDLVQGKLATLDDNKAMEYYQAHQDAFSNPAVLSVKYLLFSRDAVAATMAPGVTDQEIEEYYQANPSEFTQHAGADLTQIIFPVPENVSGDQAAQFEASVNDTLKSLSAASSEERRGQILLEHQAIALPAGWVAYSGMPEQMLNLVRDMKPGEYSSPTRSQFGYVVLRVNEVRPDKTIDLAEAKDQIRQTIARQKAGDKISADLDSVLDKLLIGENMDALAAENGLEVKQTGLLTIDALAAELELTDLKDVNMVAAAPEGLLIDRPMSVDHGYILAEIIKSVPQTPKPFDEVKDQARLMAASDEARDEARVQALAYKDGNGTDGLTQSGLFTANGQGATLPQDMVAAAFSVSALGTWLPQVYAVPEGFIAAKLLERTPPADQDWNQEKDGWMANMEQSYKDIVYASFVAGLRDRAEIEIFNNSIAQ